MLRRDGARRMDYVSGMFGIEIIDAALLPAMIVALLAGVISFLSPCVLPIVPPYLAYMSGVTLTELSQEGERRARAVDPGAVLRAGAFHGLPVSGVHRLGHRASLPAIPRHFNTVAGLLVMGFGAHFVGVYRIGFLDREARMDVGDKGGSSFGAYILGLAFAFGWTPCIGPQLGAILSLAASEATSPAAPCCWRSTPSASACPSCWWPPSCRASRAHGLDETPHGAIER